MKTIVGLFDDMEQAKRAALNLESAGVPHNDISLVANNEGGKHVATGTTDGTATGEPSVSGHAIGHDAKVGAEIGGVAGLLIGLTGLAIPGLGWIAGAGWLMGLILGAGTGAIVGGLVGALTHVGVPEEDAAHYTEGVRRGGTLVAVKASDEQASQVAQILGDDGAVDIDERAAQYGREGMPTGAVNATANVSAGAATSSGTEGMGTAQGGTVIPVVEEELAVGKRQVQGGGVRVYTHVTEKPVEENVTLHEEHVTVDRRPVDRSATNADLAFKEDTLNVTETSEEAVVSKQARVVEEVVVGKQAIDRTETVRDTVRRTDVDVEELGRTGAATGTTGMGTAETALPGNRVPGVQTGGHDADGSPDTRGITEKVADTVTGDRTDDKTGKPV